MSLRVIANRKVSEEPVEIPRCVACANDNGAVDEYLDHPDAALAKYEAMEDTPADEPDEDEPEKLRRPKVDTKRSSISTPPKEGE